MSVIDFFSEVSSFLSGEAGLVFILLFFTAIIVIYAVFVYFFYTFLAKKNIIELNLNKYNTYSHPTLTKFFAIILYILEYLILLPIVTFFWFTVLAIIIITLSDGLEINTILLISACLVAAVRATSFVNENLSRDLAKMIPFTLLAIAITNPSFFVFDSLINRLLEIPELLSSIPLYLLFIVSIELIMRGLDFVNSFSGNDDEEEEE